MTKRITCPCECIISQCFTYVVGMISRRHATGAAIRIVYCYVSMGYPYCFKDNIIITCRKIVLCSFIMHIGRKNSIIMTPAAKSVTFTRNGLGKGESSRGTCNNSINFDRHITTINYTFKIKVNVVLVIFCLNIKIT